MATKDVQQSRMIRFVPQHIAANFTVKNRANSKSGYYYSPGSLCLLGVLCVMFFCTVKTKAIKALPTRIFIAPKL